MKFLALDLRHVPIDGTAGSGVAHASRELAEMMGQLSEEYGIKCHTMTGPARAWQLAQWLRAIKADALFCPSGAVPPFIGLPAYPWVHDVAIFSHPEWFSQSAIRRVLTTNLFLRGVRRAPHVFAVSEDTKRSLVSVTGIPSDKVTVTYQGIQPISQGDPQGYALILGSVNPRKNIEFIQGLWSDVERQIPQAKLVIAGEPFMTFDDAERDELIRHASVLLLPSLHEGFGRTALEAMSAGVPVIASNRGAIPEVVGDAGLLLDPTDRKAWIEGMIKALEGRLDGKRGLEQSLRFSWEKTARIILAKLAEIG